MEANSYCCSSVGELRAMSRSKVEVEIGWQEAKEGRLNLNPLGG